MTDPVPSKERDIADDLLEAVTVLDEPFHREAVAGTIGRAAGVIDRLRSDLEELHDAHDTLERKLDTCGLQCSATMKSLLAENEKLKGELAESNQMLESEWFSRVIYKRQMRDAQERIKEIEPYKVGDKVNYLGKETTIVEVRTKYILAGGTHASALILRPAQPPRDEQ